MSIVTTSLRRTVPADFTALSLDAAKAHLRVEHDADDDLITALISAAQAHAEHEMGRVLCESTWEWCLQGPLRDVRRADRIATRRSHRRADRGRNISRPLGGAADSTRHLQRGRMNIYTTRFQLWLEWLKSAATWRTAWA